MNTDTLNIAVIDDHQILVDGVSDVLSQESTFNVVAKITDARELSKILETQAIDIVVTDLSMPHMTGLELTRTLKKTHSDIKVVVLSMSHNTVMVHELLEAGISGFVLKTAGIQELIIGIKKVAEGELYFSETVSKDLLRAIQKNQTQPLLTPREIEILKLIVAEKSNAQIGEALFISERTVESHRKNIYQKTEVQSLVGLVKYAFANKLV